MRTFASSSSKSEPGGSALNCGKISPSLNSAYTRHSTPRHESIFGRSPAQYFLLGSSEDIGSPDSFPGKSNEELGSTLRYAFLRCQVGYGFFYKYRFFAKLSVAAACVAREHWQMSGTRLMPKNSNNKYIESAELFGKSRGDRLNCGKGSPLTRRRG